MAPDRLRVLVSLGAVGAVLGVLSALLSHDLPPPYSAMGHAAVALTWFGWGFYLGQRRP